MARLLYSYVATRSLQIFSLSKFANETSLRGVAYLLESKVSIQRDLKKIVYWGQQISYDIEYKAMSITEVVTPCIVITWALTGKAC